MHIESKSRHTVEESSPIFKSERVNTFLSSVRSQGKYGFFDMDGTLINSDVEDLAHNNFGLIPNIQIWKQALAKIEGTDEEKHLLQRKLTLDYYTKVVTDDMRPFVTQPVQQPLNPEVLSSLGRSIGSHIVEKQIYNSHALDVLRLCGKTSINIVVITATPVNLAEGVIRSLQNHLDLPPITVLGTEQTFDSTGKASEVFRMHGQPKTDIVVSVKNRGGVAVIGAGDKHTTSDAFIHFCKIKGHINNNSLINGKGEWERLSQRLLQGYNLV